MAGKTKKMGTYLVLQWLAFVIIFYYISLILSKQLVVQTAQSLLKRKLGLTTSKNLDIWVSRAVVIYLGLEL